MQTNSSTLGDAGYDAGLKNHMTKTYSLLAGGLLVSAASAWLIGFTPLRALVMDGDERLTLLGTVGMWSPLLLLILSSMRVIGETSMSARLVYWAFVALQGIGLSLVALTVPPAAIVQALAITACTFGALSIYGYTTKKDISGWRNFLMMGLFGIIFASIANLFLGSDALNFAISVIGVLVFSGLTAYDTQKLKDMYYSGLGEDDLVVGRYWSALGLYLNILNLFNMIRNLSR